MMNDVSKPVKLMPHKYEPTPGYNPPHHRLTGYEEPRKMVVPRGDDFVSRVMEAVVNDPYL